MKKIDPIITSLLDTDMYKFSMQRVFLNHFANINARYQFRCRNEGIVWTQEMVNEIRDQVEHLCTLRFTEDEIKYLSKIYYMENAKFYHEFLRLFQLNRRHIEIMKSGDNIIIQAEGPIWSVSMFEIYILAIVNEVYFKHQFNKFNPNVQKTIMTDGKKILNDGLKLIVDKTQNVPFVFSDFGTRRRFSKKWQEEVINVINTKYKYDTPINNMIFSGTSNVMFAKQFGITPIGTMAHEYLQVGQALDNVTLAHSQRHMLQIWANEYRGDLGIALSDTLTTDYFLKHDFDKYFAKLFDGVRHDSGCPFEFGKKIIKHYHQLKIDPMTKTIVYSDGLDFEKALALNVYFLDKIKIAFGIGTKLTNNFGEMLEPLNIVFKIVEANGKPVAKLSDVQGKTMCDDDSYLNYLRSVVGC